jgi:hypothetical protein
MAWASCRWPSAGAADSAQARPCGCVGGIHQDGLLTISENHVIRLPRGPFWPPLLYVQRGRALSMHGDD